MTQPRLSVVVPTWQRAAVVGRAVASVLAQEVDEPFEVVVVDDGSTDGTPEALAALRDERVRVLERPHRGRSSARNAGVAAARGEIVAFLDSDDEALPGWLAALCAPFVDAAVGIVCCGARVLTDRPGLGPPRQGTRLPREMGPVYGGGRGLFLAGTFAVRRELFLAAGGYDERLAFSENTELSLRLVAHARSLGRTVESVDRALVLFRNRRPTGDAAGHAARLDAALIVLERHGASYRRRPSSYANYCTIAGVNAARLGRHREATRWLLRAVVVWPWRPAAWGRLTLSLVPPAARRWWQRHEETA